ncbi:MAG: hypothetical protein ACTSW7_01260 [Candidatus Thorarchaeota archaeon]|nr:MAG: hypothetical protein DRI46_09035 [Chloroflexota bacterium]HEC71996.1 hypothetical protein [Thermoplasmatales archaeon]
MSSDYSDVRVLLDIVLRDRSYHYSDRDGVAHSFTSSTDGRVIVEDDMIMYEGLILNPGQIKKEIKASSGKASIANVSVSIFNKDRLDLGNTPVALESGIATITLVQGDMYDQVIGRMTGRADNVSYDDTDLKFTIRSESVVLFKQIPENIFDEETFQTTLIMHDADILSSENLLMRLPISGYDSSERLVSRYAKTIKHPALSGKGDDYWLGSRVDVVDAFGSLADPESTDFAIGEFAVVINSENDEITLPTVLDRYFLYNFIEKNLRDSGNEAFPARGQLTAVVTGSLNDGDYFVFNDGINDATYFYFDTTGGYVPPVGGVEIDISAAGSAIAVANLIVSVFNGVGLEAVTSNESGTTAIVSILHSQDGGIGNIPILEFVTTSLNPIGMSGGGPTNTYQMYDVINNTMRNVTKGSAVKIINGTFEQDAAWTLGIGWTIGSGVATHAAGIAGDLIYNGHVPTVFVEGYTYEIVFDLTVTAGQIRPHLNGTDGDDILSTDPNGTYKVEMIAGSDSTNLKFQASAAFAGTIDNVEVRPIGRPVLMLIRKPVPENADSVGRPFPIVYGRIEKMWAVWAISAKSTRQNSLSAGDDVYVIAGHKIKDKRATNLKVYFGLDENAQGMSYRPGTIDYVPNPLPNSIAEIDHWNENGYSLRDPNDGNRNVAPFHRLIELTTNEGEVVTAVQLRGDEYTGWTEDNSGNAQTDGNMPGVNGQPQFPIRYGLGNSKIYVSFRGYEDETGIISGVPGGLIEHPVDIMKHFLLNYTNINGDFSKLDEQSFANAKAKLENWRFAVAITDTADGQKIMDRFAIQCKTIWREENGVIVLETMDLENRNPTVFLDEKKHFSGKQTWSRPKLSEVFNDFTFKFGFNAIKNTFDRVVRRNKANDQLCRNCYAQYGVVRSHKEIQCPDIFDSYTINKLADHHVQLNAVQRKRFKTNLYYREETAELIPGTIAEIRFYDDDDNYYDETYLILSVSMKKDLIAISALELPA